MKSKLIFTLSISIKITLTFDILRYTNTKRQMVICSQLPPHVRRIGNIECNRNQIRNLHILQNTTKIIMHECRRAFKNEIWDCSSKEKYLYNLVAKTYKESSYLYTLYSAGLVYALANACSSGLVDNCKCIEKQREETMTFANGLFTLKGARCFADSLKYGVSESMKIFKDDDYKDAKGLIDDHNKKLGQLVASNTTIMNSNHCFCHGQSGTCTQRKCVKRIPKFSLIANAVKKLFDSAIEVGIDNNGKRLIKRTDDTLSPEINQMIYADQSPDYRKQDNEHGSMGTKGRQCYLNTESNDSCKKLCFNGYITSAKIMKRPCKCLFKYCCEVKCKECVHLEEVHICK